MTYEETLAVSMAVLYQIYCHRRWMHTKSLVDTIELLNLQISAEAMEVLEEIDELDEGRSLLFVSRLMEETGNKVLAER